MWYNKSVDRGDIMESRFKTIKKKTFKRIEFYNKPFKVVYEIIKPMNSNITIEIQDPVWALFGSNKEDEWECLQVGASVNGAKDEIMNCLRLMMNSQENTQDKCVSVHTQFYTDVYKIPDNSYKNKSKYSYRKMYDDFENLIFCSIDVDNYLDFKQEEIKSNIINNMVNITKMNYAEAQFAYETQAIYWNAYRSGIDMKTLKMLLYNDKLI